MVVIDEDMMVDTTTPPFAKEKRQLLFFAKWPKADFSLLPYPHHYRTSTKDLLRQLALLFDNHTSASSTLSASTFSPSRPSSDSSSPFINLRIPTQLHELINDHLNLFASTFNDSSHEAKERERSRWREGLLEIWSLTEPQSGTEGEPSSVARVSAFLTLLAQLSADVHEDDDGSAIVSRQDIAKVWWGAVLKRVVLGTGKEHEQSDSGARSDKTRGRKAIKSSKGKDSAIPAYMVPPQPTASDALVKPLTTSREALEAATKMVVWGMSPSSEEMDQEKWFVPAFFNTVKDEYETRALATLRGLDEVYGVRNLQECLINWGQRFYMRFFNRIAPYIHTTQPSHLPFLSLLLAFLSRHSDKAKGIHETPLFATLIDFCLTSPEPASIIIGVECLIISLVQLTVLIADSIPGLFAIYARMICWERLDDLIADQAYEPESNETRLSSGDPPDAMLLFSCLYGTFPCNFTAFLRDANGYLRSKGWQAPEGSEGSMSFDSGGVRELSKPLISRHTLHPALLTSDAASELIDVARFGDADAAGVMALCDRTVVHDPPEFIPEALTAPRPSRGRRATSGLTPDDGRRTAQVRKSSASGSRSRSPTPHMPLTTHFSNFQKQQSRSTSLKSAPTSRSGSRARTPITDLADHSHPAWGGIIPSSTDSSTHPSTTNSRASSIHSPSTVHGASASITDYLDSRSRSRVRSTIFSSAVQVNKLEAEIALLQGEVDFQRYLKQLHLQYMGTLHRQKVLESGAEAERQSLYRTIRTLRAQLKQTKSSLDQLRNESSVIKVNWVSHIDDLREKLKGLREVRSKNDQEIKRLKAEIDDLKEREIKLQNELASQGAEFLDLRNQVAADSEKMSRLDEYENRIAALTKAVAISDQDLVKFKQQQSEMDLIAASGQKSELLRESVEAEVVKLRLKEDENVRLRQAEPSVLQPSVAPAAYTKDDFTKLNEELERLRLKNRDLVERLAEAS